MAADVELIGAVRAALRGAAQPELARPMQAYMKSATPFLGVRVPMMRTLTRAEAKLRPFTTSADLITGGHVSQTSATQCENSHNNHARSHRLPAEYERSKIASVTPGRGTQISQIWVSVA